MSKQIAKKKLDPTAANEEPLTPGEAFLGELNEPGWSVVTFEECVARGLTYEQAFTEMERLSGENRFGLCILTDEAASRISKRKK